MAARRPWLARLGRAAAGSAAAYGAALLLGHVFYRRLLYPAAGRADAPPPPDAELVECLAADGVTVHALAFAGRPGARTIVYFHGNGEVVGDDVWLAREMVRRGFHVVLAEYRGYGLSGERAIEPVTGAPAPALPPRGVVAAPSEAGLYADAEAVLDALAARGIRRGEVVLWGMSLGTGVAAEMARRGRGDTLVLVAPYTSIADVARHYFPFLPVRLLMTERFDTLAKAATLPARTLVLHGTDDEVVPFAMGRRVAAAIAGARFVPVPGAHHNDVFAGAAGRYFDVVRSFASP